MVEPQKRILLVIHTNTYFPGLLPLATTLKKNGNFEPIFLFALNYPTLFDDINTCRKEAIKIIFGDGVNPPLTLINTDSRTDRNQAQKNGQAGRLTRLEKYKQYLKSPSSIVKIIRNRYFMKNIPMEIRKLSRQISNFRALLRREQVSLVVLPADNRYDQSAYVKAAHLERTGVVIVPQFMAGPLEWAEYVWDQQVYRVGKLRNKLASMLYPRWAYFYKGRNLIALPGFQVIAREFLGIAPSLPWVLHSGAADFLALESEAVRDYCVNEGLPSKKMTVTGSIAHDILFDSQSHMQEKRAQLCKDLGFKEDRRLILSALPPDVLYMGRPDCDFKKFSDLVKFWCLSISSIKNCSHIVVLHPSVKYDEFRYIEDYGLKIAREPTAHVIPLCDIYVASISSTIQWAIACGKPVLNYDVFRYRYTDYQNMGGVVTVEEQQDFLSTLKKLTSDADYYTQISARQAENAEHWGHLDGKAGERLEELFGSTIKLYSEKKQSR